jgi:hypothetical protein
LVLILINRMKKIFSISVPVLVAVLALGASASVAFAGTPQVIISEFVSHPSSGNEWVELMNTTSADISLSGWKLTQLTTPQTIPHEVDLLPLSGTLPANGILVFDVGADKLNNDGDSIGLYNNSGTPLLIQRVTYGSVVGYTVTTGLETAPAQGQSGATDASGNWKVGTPTEGWFNGSPTIASIVGGINAAGVTTNMDSLSNPSSATGLYFEKTGYGRITFSATLNLTSSSTTAFLQTLGTKMDASAGSMSFDASTATQLKNAGAEIQMYGLPTGDNFQVGDLEVKDDSGNIIATTSPDYPTISGFNYVSTTGIATFSTSHFTSFGLDTTKPSVTSFSISPSAQSSLTVSGITVAAHDNRGVDRVAFTESSSKPTDWSSSGSSSYGASSYTYIFTTAGAHTLYAWAKDAAGNVSDEYASQTVTITLAGGGGVLQLHPH